MAVRFGEFVFDPEARRLLRGEDEVHLTPKGWEMLQLLLRARPRAVSKTEVRRTLWPDSHVGQGSLTVLVSELRSALGDNGHAQRYIRTVFGYGYAFVGETSESSSSTTEPGDGPVPRVVWGRRVLPLAEGGNVLGRESDVAVRLDHASVSRHHAVIHVAHGEATVEDLGSKNGTWVAGRRVGAPVPLVDGDIIVLGEMAVLFRHSAQEGPTATAQRVAE